MAAILEAHERLPWSSEVSQRIHAQHHASLTIDMRRVSFALDIPSDASPAFEILQGTESDVGGLEWKLRLCLLVCVASSATPGNNAKGKGRAVEVKTMEQDGTSGEWGRAWRAGESLAPRERMRPVTVQAQVQGPVVKQATSGWWAALFNPFAAGSYHDGDVHGDHEEEGHSEGEGEGDWAEMGVETVECLVPLRVYPGNTAFRALEVVFEV